MRLNHNKNTGTDSRSVNGRLYQSFTFRFLAISFALFMVQGINASELLSFMQLKDLPNLTKTIEKSKIEGQPYIYIESAEQPGLIECGFYAILNAKIVAGFINRWHSSKLEPLNNFLEKNLSSEILKNSIVEALKTVSEKMSTACYKRKEPGAEVVDMIEVLSEGEKVKDVYFIRLNEDKTDIEGVGAGHDLTYESYGKVGGVGPDEVLRGEVPLISPITHLIFHYGFHWVYFGVINITDKTGINKIFILVLNSLNTPLSDDEKKALEIICKKLNAQIQKKVALFNEKVVLSTEFEKNGLTQVSDEKGLIEDRTVPGKAYTVSDTTNEEIYSRFVLNIKGKKVFIDVVRGDMTKQTVDGVVNAANGQLAHGGGIARFIADAAGKEFESAGSTYISKNGNIRVGSANIMDSYNFKTTKKIINAVGPDCRNLSEKMYWKYLLKNAYETSLQLATNNKLTSIVFPSISTAIFECSPDEAYKIAIYTVFNYLQTTKDAGGITNVRFIDIVDSSYSRYKNHLKELAKIAALGRREPEKTKVPEAPKSMPASRPSRLSSVKRSGYEFNGVKIIVINDDILRYSVDAIVDFNGKTDYGTQKIIKITGTDCNKIGLGYTNALNESLKGMMEVVSFPGAINGCDIKESAPVAIDALFAYLKDTVKSRFLSTILIIDADVSVYNEYVRILEDRAAQDLVEMQK